MFGALTGGGFSPSASSGAESGGAYGGAGSVTVGGFNPPSFTFGGGQGQTIVAVALIVIAGLVLVKRK